MAFRLFRYSFFMTCALLAAVLAAGGCNPGPGGPDNPPGGGGPAPAVLTRHNINSLDSNQLASLRAGIAAMKARPVTDPTSWLYQANIHGTNDGPSEPAWDQCVHGAFQFLAWHRMYLYYFERILRAASGDPNLALPYWNYSDTSSPANRALPEPYRVPGNASNALFEVNRGNGWNTGQALLAPSAVDTSAAFAMLTFLPPTGQSPANSFGGGNPFGTGRLESTPHNVVHSSIGGFMGQVNFAAQDPIFWAHHCNIDRLWVAWLAQGGGRANPTGSDFLDQEYTFFDETGTQVTRKVGEFLDISVLGYQYESLGTTGGAPLMVVENEEEPQPMEESEERELSSVGQLRLTGGSKSVTLPSWVSEEGDEQAPHVLTIEGLNFEKPPEGFYEVYINLPEGTTPDYKSKYYVGNVSFFGFGPQAKHGHEPVHAFDITGNIRELKAAGEWQDGGSPRITFVKRDPEGVVVEEGEEPAVTIGRIRISTP